ncbi:MAG: hypothetical protein JSS79_03645 [Bacteroidetes bacterium]|nr:hypothetical protein [Bacteroidota bacterium]
MIKFYLTCTFLCAPFFIRAQETKKADSLFFAGQYLQANVEYERLLFNGSKSINVLLLKKSYCLKAEAKYDLAYNTLARGNFFVGDDSTQFKLYYESALNAFLGEKYDLALSKIQESHYYIPAISHPMIDLLEILTLNHLQKLKDAEAKFITFKTKYHVDDSTNFYMAKRFKKLKNPDKAESISHLLPGVGQMYAGYAGRGVTSLLLQTGMIAFTAYSFFNGYYFSGAFTGVGLFYMFNNGGARHAQYLAEKKNKALIEELDTLVKKTVSTTIKK